MGDILRLVCFVVSIVLVSGCGSGSGGDKAVFLDLNANIVEAKSIVVPLQNKSVILKKTISVSYEGDGVVIGFPPGVNEPDWVKITKGSLRADSSFDVIFTFDLKGLPAKEYETKVRFLTGRSDGSEQQYKDLPVRLVIQSPPTITPGIVEIENDPVSGAISSTVQLDFGDNVSLSKLEVEPPATMNWVEGSANATTNEVTLNITAQLPPGKYSTDVRLSYTLDGYEGIHLLPVTYTIKGMSLQADAVAPAAVVSDLSNQEMSLAGSGFETATIEAINIGSLTINDFTVENDYLIRFQLPVLQEIGELEVKLITSDGQVKVGNNLFVKSSRALPSGVLELDSRIQKFIYSERWDCIFIKTQTTLARYGLLGDSWVVEHSVPASMGAFSLSADESQLVYVQGNDTLVYLDAETLTQVESTTFPHYSDISESDMQLSKAASIQVLHVLNDGTVVMLVTHTWDSNPIAVKDIRNGGIIAFKPDSKTTSYRITGYSASRVPDSRDRVLIAGNDCSKCERPFTGFYSPSTNAFDQSSFDWVASSNQFELSGNGHRILKGHDIYDNEFNLMPELTTPYDVYNIRGVSYSGKYIYTPASFSDSGIQAIKEYDIETKSISNTINYLATDFYDFGPDIQVSRDKKTLFVTKYNDLEERRLLIIPIESN